MYKHCLGDWEVQITDILPVHSVCENLLMTKQEMLVVFLRIEFNSVISDVDN